MAVDIGGILNGGPEPKWYTVPGYDGVRVQIIPMKPSRRRELIRVCTTRRLRGSNLVSELNEQKLSDLLLDESVKDWKGLEFNNEEYLCTPEHKKQLDENWSEFNALWNAVVGSLDLLEEAMQEAELGNSQSGADSI